jgi:hypothetical protein
MEIPKALIQAINSRSSIEPELGNLLKAETDAEMLTIAHRIRAKMEVRADISFDIQKVINEEK